MRILTVVGARPQFIKAAALSRALQLANEAGGQWEEALIHTGQHYDAAMSQQIFEELELPTPHANLGIGSGSHAEQTAGMLVALERAMQDFEPDWVVVFGDTNSTCAGALAAAKLKIPVAHVEAGLREHDLRIPEEVNKLVSDHLADLCLAPTQTAMANLEREGLAERAVLVGDIMLDTTTWLLGRLSPEQHERVLSSLGVEDGAFVLATTHRARTREDPRLLRGVLEALAELGTPVLLPIHPGTRAAAERYGFDDLLAGAGGLRVVDPQPYGAILALLKGCQAVVTDSGGLIKESYYFERPCITVDTQTEWLETLEGGWNTIAGPDKAAILSAWEGLSPNPAAHDPSAFGKGATAKRVLEELARRGNPCC